MNYPQEKYDEARIKAGYYNMLNETIDCILSTFATVLQVTEQDAEAILWLYRNRHNTAEKDMQAAVNSVLAKQGPVIAATPADGMVSLEGVRKACTAMLLDDHGWNVSDAIYAARILCERAVLVPVPTVAEPEPTVTLVDAAEGRTLEVPASAVHEMEYPEAVMADNPIPEDLKDAVIYALTVQVGELNDELVRRGRTIESQQSLLDKYDADLICVYGKRVGELEKENAALRVQVKGLEEERHG